MDKKIEFDYRAHDDSGLVFAGSYPVERDIDVGDTVILRDGEVEIVVCVIEADGREFEGQVVGFQNWDRSEYAGLSPGDVVSFVRGEIWSCIHR
ncbi:MAG: hypothetical protein V3U43_04095 [Pseudomonadales bacterium]